MSIGGGGAKAWLEKYGAFDTYEQADGVATNVMNLTVKQLYLSATLHLAGITPVAVPASSSTTAASSVVAPRTPSAPSPPPAAGEGKTPSAPSPPPAAGEGKTPSAPSPPPAAGEGKTTMAAAEPKRSSRLQGKAAEEVVEERSKRLRARDVVLMRAKIKALESLYAGKTQNVVAASVGRRVTRTHARV